VTAHTGAEKHSIKSTKVYFDLGRRWNVIYENSE